MESEGSEVEDDFQPQNLEQRRYKMWSNHLSTPGMEFAHEMKRRADEEVKFIAQKEYKQEGSSSSSSGSSSSSNSSDSSEGEESESEKENEQEKDKQKIETQIKKEKLESNSESDSISNSDKEIEDQANMHLKRAKYQGAVERFVKKIGYGGKKNIEEKFRDRFRTMFKGRILEILRRNKFFESAKETLPKRAKQLEKVVSMKKNIKFVDVCRNIELNVKEMASSKHISRMFLLEKLPVNFLLLKPERFSEKKERILNKLQEKVQGKISIPAINLLTQVNPETAVKEEVKENRLPPKVQNKSFMSVLNEINKKSELKLEQDMKDMQERMKKKMLIQQKMGIVHQNIDHVAHNQYSSYGDVDQQMYYNSDNNYEQYREYDPYINNGQDDYDPYHEERVKSEYINQIGQPQMMNTMHQYPYDPRCPPHMVCNQSQVQPEYNNKSTENDNNEEGEDYDPLQNY